MASNSNGQSTINRFFNYLLSYIEPLVAGNEAVKRPNTMPQEDLYELHPVSTGNSLLEDQVDVPLPPQQEHGEQATNVVMEPSITLSVEPPAESSAETPVAILDDSDDARSTSTELPPYEPTTKLSNNSFGGSDIRLPSHFSWPQNSFVGSLSSGLARNSGPSEARFPDPVTKYEVHIPGRKRFIALAVTHTIFIAYLMTDIAATTLPKSPIYKKYFHHPVGQVLEVVFTALLVIITLYLLGEIVFHRPSNMQYLSIRKASKKHKCAFLSLVALAFTPLVIACVLIGLHKSASSQTIEIKMPSCKDMGYKTSILLQAPSNSTIYKNQNTSSSAVLSTEAESLRMTLSPVYNGVYENADVYFHNISNSLTNITIHFVTGTKAYDIETKLLLDSGDTIAKLSYGYFTEEPALAFPSLSQPIDSRVLDWKYHAFSENPDLALYNNITDSIPFIKVVPRHPNENCTILRMCSESNITSSELLVPVGVILTELTKVASACVPSH